MSKCEIDGKELPTPLDEYNLPDGTLVCRECFFKPPKDPDGSIKERTAFVEIEIEELRDQLIDREVERSNLRNQLTQNVMKEKERLNNWVDGRPIMVAS